MKGIIKRSTDCQVALHYICVCGFQGEEVLQETEISTKNKQSQELFKIICIQSHKCKSIFC